MTRHYPLAIFTEPLSQHIYWRHMVSCVSWFLQDRHSPRPMFVGGHYAVTRSLLAGLKQRGIPFTYNPDLSGTTLGTAIVLSSTDRLKELCTLKKAGTCKKILAGPNLVVRAGDADGVLLSTAIDHVIVPSVWVRDSYASDGVQPERLSVWAAGVDEKWWKPWRTQAGNNVIIYDKGMPELAAEIGIMVEQLGLFHTVIRYGRYSAIGYRDALNKASVCIFLTESESQGLALAEAWAMDVPTFVIQREKRIIAGLNMAVSTAPYLSSQTGVLWQNRDQLRGLLLGLSSAAYTPRRWVLENMTDALCAGKLLDLANGDVS